jgi:hypothetical protein
MKQFNEMTYDELVEYQTQINEAVRQRAYREGYKQGRADEALDAVNSYYEHSQPPTRDEIVGQAIHDLAELKSEVDGHAYYCVDDPDMPDAPWLCDADFIINREKRTIVALLRGHWRPIPYAQGVAKYAPTDCFNVHIGKAIALRRALGLDVPIEYLNAPQPTEVRVGDIVTTIEGSHFDGTPYKVQRIANDRAYDSPDNGWIPVGEVKVIDDSREAVRND